MVILAAAPSLALAAAGGPPHIAWPPQATLGKTLSGSSAVPDPEPNLPRSWQGSIQMYVTGVLPGANVTMRGFAANDGVLALSRTSVMDLIVFTGPNPQDPLNFPQTRIENKNTCAAARLPPPTACCSRWLCLACSSDSSAGTLPLALLHCAGSRSRSCRRTLMTALAASPSRWMRTPAA